MSEDVDVEYDWNELYEINRLIPPHVSKNTSSSADHLQSYPFCLRLLYSEIPFKSQASCKFQVRITFYHAANQCFFGSTWIGSLIQSKLNPNGLHSIELKEPLYFQTNISDYTTTLVIELVNANQDVLEVVGWSFLRIFSNHSALTDTDEIAVPQEKKLEFYHGSPYALFHIIEPVEEFHSLMKIPGCCLIYTLQTHDELENVRQFLPMNVLLNGDDIVPGVQEDAEEENGIVDILKSPYPIKPWPCQLNKLRVYLDPSVDKFEDYFCDAINKDRLFKDNIQADGSNVNIIERKLKIGVHNSWGFVKSPHILYLERQYPDVSPNRVKRSPSMNSTGLSTLTRDCQCLVLRSRLELNEMINHPLFAVVFQLEYVVSVPVLQPEIPSNKRNRSKLGASFGSMPLSQKITIPIRVGVFTPFENNSVLNRDLISVPLEAGVTLNPFGDCLFTKQLVNQSNVDDIGRIEFAFVQTKMKRQESLLRLQNKSIKSSSSSPHPSSTFNGDQNSFVITDSSQLLQVSSKPPIPTLHTPNKQGYETPRKQESTYLSELPRPQLYSSLIVSPVEAVKAVTLSRVAHSLLHTVNYPKIVDTQGNHPFIINPEEQVSYDVARESRDPLHANEVVIQFLALSRCHNHKTVFFTFQFYRFPQTTTERLHLKILEGADRITGDIPCVLQKSARDGAPSQNLPPGLTVRYTIDPSFMQAGEKLNFLRYLHQQKLYIDMWDGDSLMLIGSTSIMLKHLLRQGQSAVQVSQELDVVYSEYAEDYMKIAGDITDLKPSNMKVSLEAKLFIRCANIGCLPDSNAEKIKESLPTLYSTIVTPSHLNKLGASTNSQFMKDQSKTTAKLLSDCDVELATVLMTRKDVPGKTNNMKTNENNMMRKKKIDRMQAVRHLTGGADLTSSYILQKEEKVQRTRDLRTIQMYREKVKSNNISVKLEENITTNHMIHSALGRAEFFEYALQNPYPNDQVVIITTDDIELSVITNPKEWRYFKQLTNTNTAIEDQMFAPAADRGIKVFIRGNETIYVPFKFQSFTAHSITPEIGPSHPLYTKLNRYTLQTFGKDTTLTAKQIKVSFCSSESRPLSMLMVHVELHPHPIDQTFRFYHPEQTFLKKSIRLPPWQSLPGGSIIEDNKYPNVIARCTDDTAICESFQLKAGEPQEIFVKTPCGLSPAVKRFFVVLFIDEYCSIPTQIWQLYVNSLQRIDISATEGEVSRISLLLKGTQSSRMVKCFSSHPNELKLTPVDNFMLMANGVQELLITLNSLESGKRMMFVNVVDQEFHQLVKTWLVMVTCSPPDITKVFEINLKVGGGAGSNKKISFMNPYPVKKNFYMRTNRSDLVQFKDGAMMLGGGESLNIAMTFLPQQSVGSVTILVFINDREGKNEETFSIKAHYTL